MLGDWGKLIVAKGFEKLPKVQKIARSGHTDGGAHCALKGTTQAIKAVPICMQCGICLIGKFKLNFNKRSVELNRLIFSHQFLPNLCPLSLPCRGLWRMRPPASCS